MAKIIKCEKGSYLWKLQEGWEESGREERRRFREKVAFYTVFFPGDFS